MKLQLGQFTGSGVIPPNSFGTAVAAIPEGHIPMSGGFRGDIGLHVLGSQALLPGSDPVGWFAAAFNPTNQPLTLTVFCQFFDEKDAEYISI